MAFAKGKIGVFLEGGYFIDSLKEGVAMSLRALLGEPCISLGALPPPDDSVVETILNLIAMQKSVWQVNTQLARKFKEVQAKPLVKSNKSKKICVKLQFLNF